MRIIIIEDNDDLRTIYEELLEAAGHEVASSSDGLDGITQIVEFQPDVILLDIMMPEMDGYDFLKALRENTSMKPHVIVLSNMTSQKDIDRAIALGAHAYLRKSDYVGEELVSAIEKSYMNNK